MRATRSSTAPSRTFRPAAIRSFSPIFRTTTRSSTARISLYTTKRATRKTKSHPALEGFRTFFLHLIDFKHHVFYRFSFRLRYLLARIRKVGDIENYNRHKNSRHFNEFFQDREDYYDADNYRDD